MRNRPPPPLEELTIFEDVSQIRSPTKRRRTGSERVRGPVEGGSFFGQDLGHCHRFIGNSSTFYPAFAVIVGSADRRVYPGAHPVVLLERVVNVRKADLETAGTALAPTSVREDHVPALEPRLALSRDPGNHV